MKTSKSQAGFTVIELIISGIILVILLGIVGDFLISSVRLTNETEARNEMQVNARSAVEMLSQDIFSAGSNGVQQGLTCSIDFDTDLALDATQTTPQNHTLTVRYCDPYTGTPATVVYSLANDGGNTALFRNGVAAVPGIEAFEVDFICDAASCSATTFPNDVISVVIKLTAKSTWKTRGVNKTCVFDTSTCTSEAGYFYDYVQQTVSPPNLKFYYDTE